MSIFKANKKYLTQAYQNASMAEMLSNEQAVIDVNRSILQNIRQERLAESQIRFAQNMEGITTSGTAGAMGNIQSGFAEPVEYMYDSTNRMNRINKYYQTAQENLDKYQKQAKKAATVGAITGFVLPGTGSFMVGAVGGADSNFYKGNIETQLSTLSGAAKGAAAGSVAGVPGMIVGGIAGGVSGGVNSIFGQDGKNRNWAKATNAVNWSMSNYYGYQFRPVTASNWNLDLSGLGYLASGLFAVGASNTQTQQKMTQAPLYEAGGTRSSYLATGLFANNTTKPAVYEEAGGAR